MTDDEIRYQRRTRGLMIHWGVYSVSNIILFIINYWLGYSNPWHLWTLVPWGAAILIHTAVIVITNMFDRTLETRLALHGSITIITSAYLIWNDWFDDRQIEWILFAFVPLVLIWLNHLVVYRLLKPKYHKVTGDVIEPSIFMGMIDKQVDRFGGHVRGNPRVAARKIVINRIILRNHIFIYGAVNTFLFFLNWKEGIESPWFLWPTLSWGVSILFHTFGYLNLKRKTIGQHLTKKYLLVYPVTISIYLVIIDVLSNSTFDWFWWAVVSIVAVSIIVSQFVGRSKMKKTIQPQSAPMPTSDVHVQRVRQASKQFCPKCGNEVFAHHKFCQSCGFETN